MRTPKLPTARSVSATLRAHDFRAAPDRSAEGYRVSKDGSAVRVTWQESPYGLTLIAELSNMATVLRRKGWLVQDEGAYLIVTAMEEGQR